MKTSKKLFLGRLFLRGGLVILLVGFLLAIIFGKNCQISGILAVTGLISICAGGIILDKKPNLAKDDN